MSGQMYFGTRERMTWVPCPAIETDLSRGQWSTSGQYLNGGAYVRSSATSHHVYKFTWNLASGEDIYSVLDYAYGSYGQGLIYFLDPFAERTNVLPSWWAVPRLQVEDAPSLTTRRPTVTDTAANGFNYPTKSAVFTLASGDVFDSVWIPLPTGYSVHLGAHGSVTGTAEMTYTPDGGTVTGLTPLGVDTATLTNVVVSGTTGVTLSAQGVGQMTLAGVIAQVLPSSMSAPTGSFISGRGHSGCKFDPSTVTVNGYSSPQALDKMGASATLVETGGWETD